MTAIVKEIKVLEIKNPVEDLTQTYIDYKAVPETYKEDAIPYCNCGSWQHGLFIKLEL